MSTHLNRRAFLAVTAVVATTELVARGTATASTVSGAAPPRAVPTTGSTVTAVPARIGYTDHDLDPRRSALEQFGFGVRYGFDYDYRSIGADLGAGRRINGVSITAEAVSNDLTGREISLYSGEDNQTWERVDGARVVNLGNSLWLTGFDVTARYFKVHCHRETTEAAKVTVIVSDPQSNVRFHCSKSPGLIAGGSGGWMYRTDIHLQNPSGAALRDRPVYLTFDQIGLAGLIADGRVSASLADVRFLDAERRYLHSYADAHGFFVRIPEIEPAGTSLITLYSGNPSASDVVHADTGALQVEYGKRTIIKQDVAGSAWGIDVKPVRLPSGLVMIAAGSGNDGGVRAKFSNDDGRTWGPVEPILPPLGAGRQDSIGSAFVDPDTDALTVIYYSVGPRIGDDHWTDPNFHSCVTYSVRAETYDAAGRPVFGQPTVFAPYSAAGQVSPSWFLSYCNPLKTRSGAYLLPISYVYRDDSATFTAAIFRSTDAGRTWTQGADEFLLEGEGFEIGLSETTLMQMADGRVILYARQQGPGRYQYATSTSTDDGVTFSPIDHSEILASNTMPASFRDRDGTQMLTWSGHNAFGMESYQRNDITLAYSTDESPDWRGYHDLLGATRLGAPGHSGVRNDQGFAPVFVEADSTPVGDADRLFAVWVDWVHPHTVLVEDFTDYVQHSSGALDIPLHRNSYMASFGSELNSSRWWRTLPKGTMDLVPGRRPVGKTIRLRGNAGDRVAASRIFPGIRKGTVRFGLRPVAAGAIMDVCLQEGFSPADPNARGGLLALRRLPTGELLVTTEHRFDQQPQVGYLGNDVAPAAGNLGGWAASGGIAFDYQRRSIGIDLRTVTAVTAVTMQDDDAGWPPAGTRLTAGDLAIWVSDTNDGDWRRLDDWSVVGPTAGAFTLSGPQVSTRYLKVTQPYADSAFTFANDFGRILRVTGDLPADPYRPLQVPTTLPADAWAELEFEVDIDAGTVGVVVDGVRRETLPQLHDAVVATHLLIAAGAGSTAPQEVQIDELIVRDLSSPDPVFRKIARTKQVPGPLQR